jgi:hypothetical protein
MGGLAQRATLLHRRIFSKLGLGKQITEELIPNNEPIKTLASAIYNAWFDFVHTCPYPEVCDLKELIW